MRKVLIRKVVMVAASVLAGCQAAHPPTASAGTPSRDATDDPEPRVEEKILIGQVWPATKVGFCLLSHGDRQYVAYYNSDRRTVVATRRIGDDRFSEFVLPSKSDQPPARTGPASTIQGWDSHNYLVMAVDSAGHLHLSGNMHASPLNYFRTETPGDITTLKQIDSMVGNREARCTYPAFMTAPDGSLLFHYRDGGSGNGDEIYNVYDVSKQTWRRFLDTPLISGAGKCNAYQVGPRLGPDGWYHLIWMWRETPAVETNHDLSYARTRDLQHWETADGKPLTLPITPDARQTLIDPVPQNGGLHNSVHRISFASDGKPIITYYKHDPNGDTQAYAARFDDGKWNIRQVSQWKGQHVFKGGGSGPSTFGTSLTIGTLVPYEPGTLALPYRHWKAGSGRIVIDEETLAPLSIAKPQPEKKQWPAALDRVESDFPGMSVNWRDDSNPARDEKSRYVLRWESLGPNRDRPRTGTLPEKADLVLYKFSAP